MKIGWYMMSKDKSDKSEEFTTTTGHDLSEASWLDRHFAMAQPEYEAMLRSVGIQLGQRVLDAGCGSGSFIPLMSELVGESGHITALDMAQENIDQVNDRIAYENFNCPIITDVGSVTSLKYPDDHFDAVWCAAVCQYLTDEEFETMLSELMRVTRSGGIVAIKDFDLTVHQWYAPDPTLLWRIYISNREESTQFRGLFRTINLRHWLLKAGLVDIINSTTLVERVAPLSPIEKEFMIDSIRFTARLGLKSEMPESDLSICHDMLDDDKLNHFMSQPKFYFREGHTVLVARVP